jgi:hypothetical protein
MVEMLTAALAKNAAVARVIVDGTEVEYDREQALRELQFWQAKQARESGKRNLFRGVDIGSAW